MFKSNLIRPCLTKLMCCLNWTSWICSQWDLFLAILCRGRRMRKPTSPTHRANRPATGSGFFRWQSWVIPTASNGPMAQWPNYLPMFGPSETIRNPQVAAIRLAPALGQGKSAGDLVANGQCLLNFIVDIQQVRILTCIDNMCDLGLSQSYRW